MNFKIKFCSWGEYYRSLTSIHCTSCKLVWKSLRSGNFLTEYIFLYNYLCIFLIRSVHVIILIQFHRFDLKQQFLSLKNWRPSVDQIDPTILYKKFQTLQVIYYLLWHLCEAFILIFFVIFIYPLYCFMYDIYSFITNLVFN